ncbi:hypothetical protein TTRE_0000466501 [Trichuris trichiura]|uniref:Uncharacterized protein n=1 Tax=Trichuris trichiura TaxID=36087 RepID=A0A077Z7C9_TRITR|nr:hypothetical protein TTRE_0000466501 [Trichuris trichiura]
MSLQDELLELQLNVELKARLSQSCQQLWLQKEVLKLYPGVWDVCRYGFSDEQTQSAASRPGDLRLRVTSIEPKIDRLVRSHLGELSSSH